MTPEQREGTGAPEEVPGLLRAARVVRERWWIVAICAAVCLLVTVAYLESRPKEYTATSKLQFTANSIPSQVAGVPQNQTIDPEGEKATNLQLVTATPVAELVVKALKLSKSPSSVLDQIAASNPNNDYIVDVAATDTSPERAAALANAFAQQYVVYSQRENEAQLIKGEQLINQKLAQLPSGDTADRANLQALYQKLLLLQAVQTGNAKVIATATPPGSPSAPKIKSSAVVALIVGLLLGIGLIFLLDVIDRRVKSLDELERFYRLPALASIPHLPRHVRDERDRELTLEPFRILRNGLPLLSPGGHPKTVLVTSAVAGEGKTTTAVGLARASALAGQDVILVEADLRRPSVSSSLEMGPNTAPGLTTALFGDSDPLELLTPVPGVERLHVLRSGPVPLNAVDMLRSERLTGVFERLASRADLLVIDAAPLCPVVDTRTLLDAVEIDACLVVGRIGVTTRDQARGAHVVLERRPLSGVGLVVNDPSAALDGYYYDRRAARTADEEAGERNGTGVASMSGSASGSASGSGSRSRRR
ncbi:MAG TPA: GNVR domain-containing protein [Solirubrobacteraceae bacterium]|jgi:capsular exopolysaccharide synthesis family protein|nr:GNVR domain-containing protein [Solirubrobacteraceae bacterium]